MLCPTLPNTANHGVPINLTRSLDIEWLPKSLELFSLIKDLPSAFM
jgi:hypothetical protein